MNGKGVAHDGVKASPEGVDWQLDEYWSKRRLSPEHLLIHDAVLTQNSPETSNHAALLELQERLPSSFLTALKDRDRLNYALDTADHLSSNRQEQLQLTNTAREYGWMNTLRLNKKESSATHCRWIHISSKFSEYLRGTLLALTDIEQNPKSTMYALRELENCIQSNERFSKHGRYFTPFYQSFSPHPTQPYPFLISLPFLDWSLDGPTPPLRFQVDPREGYQSGRSSAHLLRSILQYFYKLEDTSDRERQQVFAKHKPWNTDRNLDLKVRRWYGHYPQALNVDELWILAIDDKHVVTFSSNQSWKSRWPPLQLPSRIAEVSFRSIRNSMLLSDHSRHYDTLMQIVAALAGAVGILHRSFWSDIPLCLTDRYAGYLSHLQYRLYRAPSTKLVMDLLQVQEELNIIIQITQQQHDLLSNVQDELYSDVVMPPDGISVRSRAISQTSAPAIPPSAGQILSYPDRATFRQPGMSNLSDPMSQLMENLVRELSDLKDLRDNSNSLVNRTIQLVNIRLEDHGKAILVFTIVTIIFLPLSFVSSFFGMNTYDIRTLRQSQWVFWAVAGSLTTAVVGLAILAAFYGGSMYESFVNWREEKDRTRKTKRENTKMAQFAQGDVRSFEVLDAVRPDKW